MILFVGLRTDYNDTFTYRYGYETLVLSDPSWSDIDWALGANPGFWLVNTLLVKLGFSTQSFIMVYAVITVGIYLWFVRKYTNNIWLTIFLFHTTGVYSFTFAAIKQCVAVAFCLIATDRALKKKWLPFVVWVLIAATFHPYSLMYLCVPFLTFCPWKPGTYAMLAVFGVLGVTLEALLGTIINITSMMGEGYNIDSFSGEGVNPFRLAVCAMPLLISWVVQKGIARKNNREQNLFINLATLNAEIMFIALFGTANYFARLANYFVFFQALALPALLNHFDKKTKNWVTCIAVVGYSAYFYYENAISMVFDENYYSISIFEYIRLFT